MAKKIEEKPRKRMSLYEDDNSAKAEVQKEIKYSLFDIFNFMARGVEWENLPEQVRKMYNQFIINRFMSSSTIWLPTLNVVTCYRFDNPQHYQYLMLSYGSFHQHFRFNYDAYKVNDKFDDFSYFVVMKELNIGKRDARICLNTADEKYLEPLKKKWKVVWENMQKEKK